MTYCVPSIIGIAPGYVVVFLLLNFTVTIAGTAKAGVNLCTEQPTSAFLEVEYASQSKEELNDRSGTVKSDVSGLRLMYQGAESDFGSWFFGVGHQYTIFDFFNLDVQTNGHQHTLYLPFILLADKGSDYVAISFAPALSVSSNVLKQANQYNVNALQGLGSIVYRRDAWDSIGWMAGICADHRFGNFRIYPVLGFEWTINHAWRTVIAYPDSELTLRLSDSIQWRLHIGPDGNHWFIKDKNLQQGSEFIYEAYLAEWLVDWHVTPSLLINASFGLVFNAEYQLALANNEVTSIEADNSSRMTIMVRWKF